MRLKALELITKITKLEEPHEDVSDKPRLVEQLDIDGNNPEDLKRAALFYGLMKKYYEGQVMNYQA